MDVIQPGRYRLAAVNRHEDESLEDESVEDDHFHDQCGVFGVFGSKEASHLFFSRRRRHLQDGLSFTFIYLDSILADNEAQ